MGTAETSKSSTIDCSAICPSGSCSRTFLAEEVVDEEGAIANVRWASQCRELHLKPGTRIYDLPGTCDCAFVLSHGVVQRKRLDAKTGRFTTVGFSGRGDLLTPNAWAFGEREFAVSVTAVSLIIIPRHALSRKAPQVRVSTLLERHLVAEMARDVKARYRLRDVPVHARLALALTYILDLAGIAPTPQDAEGVVRLDLSMESLSDWLGLENPTLQKDASLLRDCGAVSPVGDHLDKVFPRKLKELVERTLPTFRKDAALRRH